MTPRGTFDLRPDKFLLAPFYYKESAVKPNYCYMFPNDERDDDGSKWDFSRKKKLPLPDPRTDPRPEGMWYKSCNNVRQSNESDIGYLSGQLISFRAEPNRNHPFELCT